MCRAQLLTGLVTGRSHAYSITIASLLDTSSDERVGVGDAVGVAVAAGIAQVLFR